MASPAVVTRTAVSTALEPSVLLRASYDQHGTAHTVGGLGVGPRTRPAGWASAWVEALNARPERLNATRGIRVDHPHRSDETAFWRLGHVR
jgi:hypothetical protein